MRLAGAAWVAVAVGVLGGCAGPEATSAPPPSTVTTYPVPAEAVRPDEKALHLPTTADGDTAFTLLGMTTGMTTLIGSHAEFQAKGQFARVRLSVVNNGRSSVLFNARRHVLVDDQKHEYAVDTEAMTIKRQPESFDLGANVRVEYDVYYDLPATAKPMALRVYGGPTLTDLKDESGTEIRLAQ
ncbi:DUF4352 domain-containing protein [Saccharothrix obliqua]|uniref:DUF4352 domain-containing protein n=1 Tax=Saccharothrix obliqua TaxID=2861747 RepID=UPI001C5CD018|nr:DUF4352 domain-containing protein [Saccharothrix obliqua]MBW4719933.1 DUF4352 domain-containing protein [Saccharothrix obliqua]